MSEVPSFSMPDEASLRADLEVALERGTDGVDVDVAAHDPGARALVERLGFERASRRGPDDDTVRYRFGLRERADVRVRLMLAAEATAISALVESAYAADFDLSKEYRASIAAVDERALEHQVWVATDAASGMLLGTLSTPRAGGAISPLARDDELDFRFLGVAAEARRRGIGETAGAACRAARADPRPGAGGAQHRTRHARGPAPLRSPRVRPPARTRVPFRAARRIELPHVGVRPGRRGARTPRGVSLSAW